jgi:sugar lactone lactonase YvrE
MSMALACGRDPEPQPLHVALPDEDARNAITAPPVVATIGNLAGPESALYDPDQDVYFISNINGGILDRDSNGFISRVDARSLTVDLKWIESGRNGVALDGPRGMAIVGDTLYAADVAAVRKFDRRTGTPLGSIELPGATLINDLTTDGARVFVSDTGVIPAAGEAFAPTGTDAVWVIEHDQAHKIASGPDLHQPNGLLFDRGMLWVVPFEGNEIYRLTDGRRVVVSHLPAEQLDGIVRTSTGNLCVSSWKGMAVYCGSGSGAWHAILQTIPTPADLGYDTKRHLLLVPSSSSNRVTLHAVR